MTCIPVVILKSISRILATFLDILVDIIKILRGLNFHNKNTTALVFKEKMFWFISLMLLHLPIFEPLWSPGNHGDSGLWEESVVKTKQLLMSLQSPGQLRSKKRIQDNKSVSINFVVSMLDFLSLPLTTNLQLPSLNDRNSETNKHKLFIVVEGKRYCFVCLFDLIITFSTLINSLPSSPIKLYLKYEPQLFASSM